LLLAALRTHGTWCASFVLPARGLRPRVCGSPLVPTLRGTFPLIKAFVWFDIDKERHWQINSSPSSLASYARMAEDPYLNP
jgi:hypothetical protein